MMRFPGRVGVSGFLLIAALASSSCGGRVRIIPRGNHAQNVPLLTATKQELIAKVADFYNAVQSFSAEVNLTSSLGSVYKGKITDYPEVTAFFDFRKPAELKITALIPIVRTTLFSMVSDGKSFSFYIPSKNRFIEGANDAPAVSPNKMENIRPETFLSAMLVKPVDLSHEMTILLDDTTETNSFYQFAIVKLLDGDIRPLRRITFDRVNLQMVEQREYDAAGTIVSLSTYSDWQVYNNIRFPSHIHITRPKDEYGVVLSMVRMDMNKPVPDSKFVLTRPEGTELQVIGSATAAPSK